MSQTDKKKTFVVGATGSSASGKTTFVRNVKTELEKTFSEGEVVILALDSYYRTLTSEQSALAKEGKYNFDTPRALDLAEFAKAIKDIKDGLVVQVPTYDFTTHSRRENETTEIDGSQVKVLLVEGLFIFHTHEKKTEEAPELWDIHSLIDLKLFVDVDDDVCLSRRIVRDCAERGRDIKGVMTQYFTYVKPGYERYVFPTKRDCDLIIPEGGDNKMAVDIVVNFISSKHL